MQTLKENTNGWGGARKGAGRPAGIKTVGNITIRIPEDVAQILNAQKNKTAFIIDAIRAYQPKSY